MYYAALCLLLFLLFVVFVHTALSVIQYDRLALLEMFSSLNTEFFSTYRSACCGSFVLPPVCLPISQWKRKKTGKRAGILCRSRTRSLGVYIKDDLTWSMQAGSAVKSAQKRLYFLRRLK